MYCIIKKEKKINFEKVILNIFCPFDFFLFLLFLLGFCSMIIQKRLYMANSGEWWVARKTNTMGVVGVLSRWGSLAHLRGRHAITTVLSLTRHKPESPQSNLHPPAFVFYRASFSSSFYFNQLNLKYHYNFLIIL